MIFTTALADNFLARFCESASANRNAVLQAFSASTGRAPDPPVYYIISERGDDLRCLLFGEEEPDGSVWFFTSIGRFQGTFDRQQMFIIARLDRRTSGEK
jgi:hypothetical protein